MFESLIIIFVNVINLLITIVYPVNSVNIDLNHGWMISNENGSIQLKNQNIPSGIFSALEETNITESLHISFNDVRLRWIANENWTYTLNFQVPNQDDRISTHSALVFHGIDTVASIYLNDNHLTERRNTQNMFVRYRYDITNILKEGTNVLKIALISPIWAANATAKNNKYTPPECPPAQYNGECHMNFLRKMQASFAWDWGLAAPSIGLWKPVEIQFYDTLIIRDVTYALYENINTWLINVTVHLEGALNNLQTSIIKGQLILDLIDVLEDQLVKEIIINSDISGEYSENISFEISKNKVDIWWPNGYGKQPLFTLKVEWIDENSIHKLNEIQKKYVASKKSVKIGFRTVELVEENLDNGYSFYFKVNNVSMFMKGTNWIPSNILPEKSFDTKQIKHLMMSVKNANMNMMRVWGGGIYETDYFYDLADEYGILIWQDMMFACAMYPIHSEFLDSVAEEIKQNIRRIQSHPSIAVWAGNNENEAALQQNWYGTQSEYTRFYEEYIKLYDDVIKNEIIKNDKWHMWLYSSPSNGHRKSQESIIQHDPQDGHFGDMHFYNYLMDGWNPTIYPKSRFISEYGFQSFPALNSWQSVMNDDDDNLLKLIEHRQHFPSGNSPILNQIPKHLPLPNVTDENYINALIYFSQINQAMTVKIETEKYRIERIGIMKTMGALYWQLNDVWIAPSWSSIEYNGNFKILHHWAKDFFAPISVICLLDELNHINLYVVNDKIQMDVQLMKINLRIYKWANLNFINVHTWNFAMKPNTVSQIDKFKIDTFIKYPMTRNNSLMEFVLQDNQNNDLAVNYMFPESIKNMYGIVNPNIQLEIISSNCSNTDELHNVKLQIKILAPAIFVYIQINHNDIKQYSLSNNGFMQLKQIEIINLNFQNPNCSVSLNKNDIKILTVNDFMK